MVLAALDASDVPVASVTVSRPSLDDVYLRYAGRSFVEADERTRNDDDQPPQQRRGSASSSDSASRRRTLMALALRHGYCMMGRELLALWRQPWWIAITLMQPIIWLLLFGAMFERVSGPAGLRLRRLHPVPDPGVVVMTAFFSASWSGMGMINDLDKVTDRMLVSPVARSR